VAASVSVVVSAYTEHRWQNLLDCIDSLRRQTVPPLEIILVIDHNPDLLSRVRTDLPDVIALPSEQPRGLSGCRNTGWLAAQGDVVAFLDDDAEAASDWLDLLVTAYRRADVAGVGGDVQPRWLAGRPRWFPAEFDWVVGCSYVGLPLEAAPVRNLIGCNMSFRRPVLAELEGFRIGIGRIEGRPLGCEETEFCIRVRQRRPGEVLLYIPDARVYHTVPPDRGQWSYFLSRCYAEGRSKADVTGSVGTGRLGVELRYSLRVLPAGLWRGLVGSTAKNGGGGLARAGAIVAGFGLTAWAYLLGRVTASPPTKRLRAVFSKGYQEKTGGPL
jgi:GT2 family glycosyltransferase